MEIIKRTFTLDGGINSEWRCDVYADTHFGSASVAEGKLSRDIAATAASGNWAVHLGDIVDGIIPTDKRYNRNNLADWAKEAYFDERLIEAEWNKFKEVFSPIKDKMLFALSGDGKHDCMNDVANNFKRVREEMGIIGGFPACFLELSFGLSSSTSRKKIQLFYHHGWFSSRTSSSKVLNLQRALNQFPEALGVIVSHGHEKVATKIEGLTVERNDVKSIIRRAAMTGSYLRTYKKGTVGYGEVKGYNAATLGHITLVLRPFCQDPEKRIEFENM